MGPGKSPDDDFIVLSPLYIFRVGTSTWSMGKMCAVWPKVLCMPKFEREAEIKKTLYIMV